MLCKNHSERDPIGTCSRCGEPFCKDCVIEIDGRYFCEPCKDAYLAESAGVLDRPPSRRRVTAAVVVAAAATIGVLVLAALVAVRMLGHGFRF